MIIFYLWKGGDIIFIALEADGAGLTAYQSVVDAVGTTLSVSNVTQVLVYAVGVCIGLVFLWWAVRKVSGMLMRAFKRGKLRL